MKIALVHDWLTTLGGGERVLLVFHEMFPTAPIYTTIYNQQNLPQFKNAKIITSYLNKLPFAKTRHQILIPLMPKAVESYKLETYDIILSDSSACAKGAIKRYDAIHICYVHTPLRYVWYPSIDPRASSSFIRRLAVKMLKKWDLKTIDRVDIYLANSKYTRSRIKEIYNRDSEVIYPPIDTDKFQPSKSIDNYFLYVGRLVSYKKPELVIEAFNILGLPLKVIGNGPELTKLKSISKTNIEFLGRVSDDTLKKSYSKCQALIFPTIEDFGMIPVEVMASGRPVIALDQGGTAESIIDGKTGIIMKEQSTKEIITAVNNFDSNNFDSQIIRDHALKFDISVFKTKIKKVIENAQLKK